MIVKHIIPSYHQKIRGGIYFVLILKKFKQERQDRLNKINDIKRYFNEKNKELKNAKKENK